MKSFAKTVILVLLLLAIPMSYIGQTVQDNIIKIELSTISNPDYRYCLLNAIANDGNIAYVIDEEESSVLLSSTEDWDGQQFQAYYNELRSKVDEEYRAFSTADKETQGASFTLWKENMPRDLFVLLFRQMLIENPTNRDGNQTCANSDPFCTTDVITFHVDASASGSCEAGPNYGCMTPYTQRPPFWFHMKIGVAGTFTIQITNSNGLDLDFCAWGPFTDPITPCPNQLTSDKIIDCDSPWNTVQECIVPSTSQVGQYYLMVITKWSSGSTDITFQKLPNSGPGETDCGILPGIVTNDGPYCVGETIQLHVNAQDGATYSWTGPGGYTSSQQNPTRPNCTMAMAGTYTCTTTVGTQTTTASTEVTVYPSPTANFNYTSVCYGNPTQFTSTSTTNPSGQQIQSYQWNFGDGQTGSGQSVTHTYAQAGNYPVSLTVSTGNGHCTDTKTQSVPVYAAPVASATAFPTTVVYGGTSTLSAQAGTTGSFNFHWEPENMVVNADGQTTQTVPLQASQTYTVTVTNPQGGCSSTAQVTVSMEGSNMTAMASADQTELCEGESTTLHALPSGGTENYTYSWTPANSLNNATIQHPTATPPVGTTTYTCTVSDGITSQNVSVTIVVHPNEVEELEHYICENDFYDFYGESIQAPGIYEHLSQTEFGCEKIIRLHLYNYDTYETSVTDHFCQNEQYMFYGQALVSPGIYTHTLQSEQGCDSVIRLNLIQDPTYEIFLTESTCEGGDGYYYHGDYLQPSPFPYIYDFPTSMGCDSIVSLLIEESEYNSKTYNVSLCATQYTWPSNGLTYYDSGTYYDTLSFPGSCDSTLTLNLELRPSYDLEEIVTSCDSYHWINSAYQVDQTFTESTVYTHHYTNSYGCNSEVTLYLTINDHDDIEFTVDEEESCDSYFWNPEGHEITFTDHDELEYNLSGSYHRTYLNRYGCDSLVTMNVQFEYTPHPTEIYPMDATNTAPHWVVTATEFQINSYDFNLWDTNPNCRWDSVTWNFTEPLSWILEPFGENNQCCKVYVLNRVEDTIWLEAHAYNRCAREGVEQRYWLVCSFVGLDENNTETEASNFYVIPNPNKGQMQLRFDELTGKIDMKVYDMRGVLIDQFQTTNNGGPCTYTYDMKTKTDGIYFFVATNKEGTVAKKVVIQK